MSIYVYRSKASQGARELATALDGRRIRQERNIRALARPGDTVVAWGEAISLPGITVLNGGPFRSKLSDIQVLTQAGIRTVQASPTRPTTGGGLVPAAPDPARGRFQELHDLLQDWTGDYIDIRSDVVQESARVIANRVAAYLDATRTPAPIARHAPSVPDPNWFGRSNNHVGGLDLLTPPTNPDYWVKKETLTEEYRVHVFDGRSIRAGKKAQRRDFQGTVSTWIRSFDGGWKIVYDRYESSAAQRQLAAAAVAALGLTFGAVDLGLLADGSLIVLEVNRAPGLEGGTIEAYARAIERWEEAQERAAA